MVMTILEKSKKAKKAKKAKKLKTSALLLLALLSLSLSGCAVMGNDFDCKKVGGIEGCVSLDQVYTMSNQDQLPDQESQRNQRNQQNQSNQGVAVNDQSPGPTRADNRVSAPKHHALSGYRNAIPQIGQPVRFGDKIQQITIFPYQDSAGNYHEASIVYAVLKPSHWIDYPVSQVQTDDNEV